MKYLLAPKVVEQLKKIQKKNPKLFAKVQKQLRLFAQNHRHPSLKTHRLSGDLSDSWSISITGEVRMLYYLKENKAVFLLLELIKKFMVRNKIYAKYRNIN